MKKLTALILTLSMLLSMLVIPMGASAMTEDERKEILNAREYTYLNIDPNIDAYASLETIRNYANTNNAVNSTDAFNKVTTVYGEDGETVLYTYMNQLLNKTHDGKDITGNETYYKKGISSAAEDAVRMSPMLFVTESFKLTEAELKALPVKTYTDLSSSSTTQNPATIAAARYADPTKFAEKEVKLYADDLNYLPTVVNRETEGDNYYITIKDPETSAQFKLGPINDSEFVKNALDVTRGTNGNNYAVVPAGTKGKMLSYAVTTADVNGGSSYSNNYALNISGPTAALSEVEIIYADNYKETRYVLTTKSVASPIDDMVGLAIWSADKYDSEGNEITYTAESFLKSTSSANPLTALTGTNLTLDDIIFPENVDAKEINVAIGLRARQDTANNNYGNKAAFGTFELQDKEIKSINFVQDGQPGKIEIEGLIGLYRTETDAPRALIPVKLPEDKADANKVYFAYVGRFANSVALLGATVVSESLKDKIDALNAEMSILDSASLEEEDIANYRAQIAEVKAQSEYILDSDFDTSKLEEAEERIVDEKAEVFVNEPAKVNFPLTEETGANSKLFLLKGSKGDNIGDTYDDFIPMVDFGGMTTRYTADTAAAAGYTSGLGYYPTCVFSEINKKPRAIIYTIEGTTDNTKQNETLNLATKNGQIYWNINGVDYNVNPTGRAIKLLSSVHTELIDDEALAAKVKTLGELTLDVVDGYYNSIGFLIGGTSAVNFKYKLVYEDETTSSLTSPSYTVDNSVDKNAAKGFIYQRMINPVSGDNRNDSGGHRYVPITITTEPTKKLKAIQMTSNSSWNTTFVISAWGNAEPIAKKLEALESIEVTDEESFAAAKKALADFDAYIAMLGYTLADLGSYKAPYVDLKAEIAEFVETLKLKRNFPISAAKGANAKLFIDHATYQTYKKNESVGESFVKGLDYTGIVNYTKDNGYPSYPTGKDTDFFGVENETNTRNNNAFIYKIDQTNATGQYSGFVNLTTKNDDLVWTVNGTDFVINPYEKAIKIYSKIDASGVEDADLRADFETLKSPVLDIENGLYESITILAGSTAAVRNFTPTVIYEDGNKKQLAIIGTKGATYDKTYKPNQEYGWNCLQSLTNWGNTNSGGSAYFDAFILTGYDTTKVIDKISFESDGWGSAVFVISAFAETATIEEVLNSADATDYDKAKAALDTVDAIFAENNITADDLTVELAAKYNELKEVVSILSIKEIALENNVVTVKYTNRTTADVGAILVIAQYKDEEENEFASVAKYPVTFTTADTTLTQEVEVDANNKVKVFVWKDLTDFFPLTANIYGK